jgi:polyisoprenoid-binding protein YceI
MTRLLLPGFSVLPLLCLAATPALAVPHWTVTPDPHTISWQVTQGGKPLSGRCAAFTADIAFDPAELAGSAVTVIIDTASCQTGDAQKDAYLPQAVWFNVAGFPDATFKAHDFQHLKGDDYLAKGSLTLKGATKKVDLPFTLVIDGDKAHLTGETTLQRLAFGLGDSAQLSAPSVAGLDVKVKIDLKAVRQ